MVNKANLFKSGCKTILKRCAGKTVSTARHGSGMFGEGAKFTGLQHELSHTPSRISLSGGSGVTVRPSSHTPTQPSATIKIGQNDASISGLRHETAHIQQPLPSGQKTVTSEITPYGRTERPVVEVDAKRPFSEDLVSKMDRNNRAMIRAMLGKPVTVQETENAAQKLAQNIELKFSPEVKAAIDDGKRVVKYRRVYEQNPQNYEYTLKAGETEASARKFDQVLVEKHYDPSTKTTSYIQRRSVSSVQTTIEVHPENKNIVTITNMDVPTGRSVKIEGIKLPEHLREPFDYEEFAKYLRQNLDAIPNSAKITITGKDGKVLKQLDGKDMRRLAIVNELHDSMNYMDYWQVGKLNLPRITIAGNDTKLAETHRALLGSDDSSFFQWCMNDIESIDEILKRTEATIQQALSPKSNSYAKGMVEAYYLK